VWREKKKNTFIQTLRIAGCQLWLTQAIVCTAPFNKFSPKKKSCMTKLNP